MNFLLTYFTKTDQEWLPQYTLASIDTILSKAELLGSCLYIITNGRILERQIAHENATLVSPSQLQGLSPRLTYAHNSSAHEYHYLRSAFMRLFATFGFLSLVKDAGPILQVESDVFLYSTPVIDALPNVAYLHSPLGGSNAGLLYAKDQASLDPLIDNIVRFYSTGVPETPSVELSMRTGTLTEMDFLHYFALGKGISLNICISKDQVCVYDMNISTPHIASCSEIGSRLRGIPSETFTALSSETNRNLEIRSEMVSLASDRLSKRIYNYGERPFVSVSSTNGSTLASLGSVHLVGNKRFWPLYVPVPLGSPLFREIGRHDLSTIFRANLANGVHCLDSGSDAWKSVLSLC